jgi:hypothetical protein
MRQAERHQRRAMTALLVGIDLSELQLEVLAILEGVIAPEARADTEGYFGECLRLAGGAPRILHEAIANIRGRHP